jgi:hypothetical protein
MFIPLTIYSATPAKSVLVLPVVNQAGLSYDNISSIMQMYLTRYFGIVKGYSSFQMPENDLISYNIPQNTLLSLKNILTVGKDKKSRYVVQVVFVEDEHVPDKLVFTFKVYDVKTKRIFFTYKESAKGDITILQTLEQIAISTVENVTGVELLFGTLVIKTDKLCQVYIDGNDYVETPYKDNRILTGMHHIKIVYNYKTIFDESREVFENQTTEIDIPVQVPLTITADKPCEVQIDSRKMGQTPYETEVVSGQEYSLKVMYYDAVAGLRRVVYESTVSTKLFTPVTIDVPANNSINLTCKKSGGDISGTVYNNKGYQELPYAFSELFDGTYRLSAYLNDPKWKTKHFLYNKKISIASGTTRDVPVDTWKPLWGLTAIPAASQLHNRKFVKAGMILGGFLTGLSIFTTGLSGLLYNELITKPKNYQIIATQPYLATSLISQYELEKGIYSGFLIGGIITFVGMWIYSIIDGILYTNRIKMIKADKKRQISVNMDFNLTIITK